MPNLKKDTCCGSSICSIEKRNRKTFIGIDPGMNGGLVAICQGSLDVVSMPKTERDTWDWFRYFDNTCFALIEKVHSMPKQGVASSFKFGMNYGYLRACLVAAQIPFEEVTPQVWQKGLSIPSRKKTESKSQFKNKLLQKAQQLFPAFPLWEEPRSKGRQLAVCDALLIAEYCRRIKG